MSNYYESGNIGGASTCTKNITVVSAVLLSGKVQEIFDTAIYIRNSAETIRGKLFGQQPQPPSDKRNPCCVEDVLSDIAGVLQEASKILNEINERT